MTTWHNHEPLEEALWFAFHCAADPELDLNVVVIVVDSESPEARWALVVGE
jgi:hypothetical protein